MAFWNFTHGVLHMHVWMLPTIVLGVIMALTGWIHGRRQKKREKDYNEALQGATPEAPAQTDEEVQV